MSPPYLKTILLFFVCYAQTSVANSGITELSNDDCQQMVNLGVMSADAPVSCARLRRITFDYIDFKGAQHQGGKIIVMDAVAPYIANIFDELFKLQFPIHQARPISYYAGDDNRSMVDNNSTAFNYRAVTGKRSLSLHAYGLAIDINPIQNPFITFDNLGVATFNPRDGAKYANRMRYRLGKKQSQGFTEEVVTVFANNGFLYWGGFWDTPIDYQHFQVSPRLAHFNP